MNPRRENPPVVDLLRHGKTQTDLIFRGQVDDLLDDTGWQQMRVATSGLRWSRILTSPLSRCRQFAEELATQLGLDPEVDKRLAEYHFGDWDGRSYSDVMDSEESLVQQFFTDPFSVTPPNAEPFVDFHQRVVAAYREISSDSNDERTLVVTHGGVILSILAEVLGRDRLHHQLEVPYASISRIQPGRNGMPDRLVYHGAGKLQDQA